MEGTYVAHARCINIIKFDHRSMPGIWPLDPRIFESSRINLTVSGIELCGSFLSSFFFFFFHSFLILSRPERVPQINFIVEKRSREETWNSLIR